MPRTVTLPCLGLITPPQKYGPLHPMRLFIHNLTVIHLVETRVLLWLLSVFLWYVLS